MSPLSLLPCPVQLSYCIDPKTAGQHRSLFWVTSCVWDKKIGHMSHSMYELYDPMSLPFNLPGTLTLLKHHINFISTFPGVWRFPPKAPHVLPKDRKSPIGFQHILPTMPLSILGCHPSFKPSIWNHGEEPWTSQKKPENHGTCQTISGCRRNLNCSMKDERRESSNPWLLNFYDITQLRVIRHSFFDCNVAWIFFSNDVREWKLLVSMQRTFQHPNHQT